MANVPTVPGSEVDISTGPSAVPLNARALNVRQRGTEAIAGAVEGISDQVLHVEDKIQKARELGIAADVDLKLRTARQTFIEGLRNDSDQDKWVDKADEVSKAVHEDITSTHENVPPEMRAQIDRAFKNWQGGLLTETHTMANVQTVNRAWSSVRQDFADSLKDGHADHAAMLLSQARDKKLANPALIDQMERDIPRTIATNYIEHGFATNPKGTTDMLKSGASLPAYDQDGKPIVPSQVLTSKEMDVLLNTGRVRTAAWQKNNFQELLKNNTDQATGFVPDNVIKDKMKSGEIEQQTGMNLIGAQDRKLKATTLAASREVVHKDQATMNAITARIHDSTAWKADPEVYAKQMIQDASNISDSTMRQRAINDANHQLESVKKNGETAERPVERRIYDQMNNDREYQGAMLPVDVQSVDAKAPGVFSKGNPATTRYVPVQGGLSAVKKMSDEEIKANFGPKATKDSIIEEVTEHSGRIQSQMQEWFKSTEGKDATWEQANDHRKDLERPYVQSSVRDSLAKMVPVKVNSPKELKDLNLPAGAPFIDSEGTLRYAK